MNKNIKIVKNTWDRKTLVFIQYLIEFSGEKIRIYNIFIEIKMTLMLNSFIFFTSKNDVHSYKSCNTFIHMSTWQVQWTEIIPVFIVYMKLQSSKNRRHKKILIILIIEKKFHGISYFDCIMQVKINVKNERFVFVMILIYSLHVN